ncbi:transmembrane protein 254 isoform X2 [Scyliorhinus canicula]|uniref:transmembrane protein 254 isoform X2 n=1 Tax=Scyliorhinus canicula TaxID=7830 RepID=UPI0018F4BE41|nr:transmembrane protein 254 isoform X2 [Scyliorhinus canicula]
MPDTGSSTYFRRTSLFWMAVITGSFGYFTLLVFWPQSVPYKSLGPWGSFSKYLVDHYHPHLYIGDKGITNVGVQSKWAFQTFLFGITSLWHLLSYEPGRKKK